MDERERHADPLDNATDYQETVIDDHVRDAMRKCLEMPEGNPGTCDLCGEWFGRLVNGACGFCRDKYRIDQ